MLPSELLRGRLGLRYMDDGLDLLDALSGYKIAETTFFPDAGWVNARNGELASVFLNRYFLPIAERGETWVGIHLLPAYVAAERCAIAELDLERDHLLDHAYSVRAYLYRKLLELEAEDDLGASDLSDAKAILGADFYEAGLHGQYSASELERMMIDRFGGAPIDYQELFYFAQSRGDSLDAQIHWLKCASEAFPEIMYFHANLARLYGRRGDTPSAAKSFARSLECYHHTAHALGYHSQSQRDLAAYYAWGRQLLESAPAAFNEVPRQDLTLQDGASRIAWIVTLFQAGEIETSVKLVSDFRRDSRADLHAALLKFLQHHYERLGWEWAMIWCEMCTAGAGVEGGDGYTYMGHPLPPGWDEPVRAVLDAMD